jgi:hypothetical protein
MATERNTRGRAKSDKTASARQEYQIDFPEWFWEKGLRVADLLIMVDNGRTEQVAKQIFQRTEHVISTSWRINAIANLVAEIYYTDSNMLNDTIESIKSIDNVSKVEFSEIVKVVDRRSTAEIHKDIEALSAEKFDAN